MTYDPKGVKITDQQMAALPSSACTSIRGIPYLRTLLALPARDDVSAGAAVPKSLSSVGSRAADASLPMRERHAAALAPTGYLPQGLALVTEAQGDRRGGCRVLAS